MYEEQDIEKAIKKVQPIANKLSYTILVGRRVTQIIISLMVLAVSEYSLFTFGKLWKEQGATDGLPMLYVISGIVGLVILANIIRNVRGIVYMLRYKNDITVSESGTKISNMETNVTISGEEYK